MRAPRRSFVAASLLVAASAALTACGSDDSGDAAPPTTAAPATTAAAAPTTGSGTPPSAPEGAVPVEQWADQVCGSVGDWLQGINTKGQQLQTDVQGVSDLSVGRDLLVQFMEDAVALTDSMLQGVEAAGAPAVPNGEQLSADLLTSLEPVKQTFEDAVGDAEALPTDDSDAFRQAATALGEQITVSQSTFSESFDALQQEHNDPSLNAAFNSVDSCVALA